MKETETKLREGRGGEGRRRGGRAEWESESNRSKEEALIEGEEKKEES